MTKSSEKEPAGLQGGMRLDKWLKTVRIFKKRSEAAAACQLGRVKLNGQVAKAGRLVKIGDAITVKKGSRYLELEVLAIPRRGLSGKDARLAYRDKTPALPEETRELLRMQRELERKAPRKFKGRPTKKERRDWERFQS